ncbi:MAG: TonB-dependent receptor [Alphaproteobacteria bacterium]|nr:TonB-dependent receptor [Alphaproteobacteria bacterium]
MINTKLNISLIITMFLFISPASTDDVLPLINGKVSDIDNGESLPYATVSIKNTNRAATANQDGSFTILNIPIGSILVIKKLGYENKEIKVTSDSKKLNINLFKVNKNDFVEDVVVVGSSNSSTMQQSGISQISLSPSLTSALPNLGEQDIFRTMQLLPGVSGSNESSSGLVVRGGTIDQNLVLFDDFTVYHVDHVFGFFSAFNNNAIKDVQLSKGGFGAKYGGRMSSVVDITGKDGNTEQFGIGASVSLLSTSAVIEQPFSDGAGSFILTGRRSYQSDLYNDILESVTGEDQNAQAGTASPGQFALGRFAIEPESYFYDVNAKLTYRFPNDNKISLSFYNGADELDNSRSVDGNANLERLCELIGDNGPFGGTYCDEEISFAVDTIDLSEWGNTGFSVKYSHRWNDRLDTNFVLSTSEYFSYRDRLIDTQVVYEDSDDDPTTGQSSSNEDNNLDDFTVKIENDLYLNQWNTVSFGLQYTQQNIDFTLFQNDELTLETKNDASTLSIYFEDEIILDALTIVPGLRINHYDITDEIYSEPRLSLAYELNDTTQLRAAFGDYHQFALSIARQSIEEGPRNFWTLADGETIPVSKARHFILGSTHYFGLYDFNIELFHKEYENLSEFTQQTRPIRNEEETGLILILEEEFHTGSGTASGIELFLQKNIGDLTGWTGYTYSEVIYDFPTVSDTTYFADQDTTHEFKTVLMYQWNDWDLASTFIYATGKPFTEVLGVKDDTFPPAYEVGIKNDERYDAYHRLDLSATYNFERRGLIGQVGLSVFNLYDRKNQWYTEYDIIEGEILETEVNYRGFTPSLFFKIDLY